MWLLMLYHASMLYYVLLKLNFLALRALRNCMNKMMISLISIIHVLILHVMDILNIMDLIKDKTVCIPKGWIRRILVKGTHERGLMNRFGVQKTYDILHEHFYWPYMKHDMHTFFWKCIDSKKAKSKVMPHVYSITCSMTSWDWYFYGLCFMFVSIQRRKIFNVCGSWQIF